MQPSISVWYIRCPFFVYFFAIDRSSIVSLVMNVICGETALRQTEVEDVPAPWWFAYMMSQSSASPQRETTSRSPAAYRSPASIAVDSP